MAGLYFTQPLNNGISPLVNIPSRQTLSVMPLRILRVNNRRKKLY